MPEYAKQTTVSPERSRLEIERTLIRYGATGFMYGWQGERYMVGFELDNRRIRLDIHMPHRSDRRICYTPTGRLRSKAGADKAYRQAMRQRWRALALIIKAKLEAIEAGVTTLEAEFLNATLLPSGQTVGEWLEPQIRHIYETGQMPAGLLPGPEASS